MMKELESKKDLEVQRIAGEVLLFLRRDATTCLINYNLDERIEIYEKAFWLIIEQVSPPKEKASHLDYLNWWRQQWGFEQVF